MSTVNALLSNAYVGASPIIKIFLFLFLLSTCTVDLISEPKTFLLQLPPKNENCECASNLIP